MAESLLLRNVRLAACRITEASVRLFRNNVGQGWVGRTLRLRPGQTVRTKDGHAYTTNGGEVLIIDPRPLHAGLVKGSGDAVGWTSLIITPDMVGRRIAVFTSIETKVPDTGRLSPEQRNWHTQVQAAGGYSIIARDEADVGALARPPPATPG